MQTHPYGYRIISLQKRNPLNVLDKAHDECKTETMLLDIWKARGRSGSQDHRVLADAGGRRARISPWILLVFLPSWRQCETGTVLGLYKPETFMVICFFSIRCQDPPGMMRT